MSTLFFIRHAQASFAKADYDQLSDLGIHQAGLLAHHLFEQNIVFDKVYLGPQKRHHQTAEAYFSLCRKQGVDGFPIVEMEELAEYDFGGVLRILMPVMAAEDASFNDDISRMFVDGRAFQRVFETAALRWVNGDYPKSDLMTWNDFSGRVNRGLDTILEQDGKGRRVAVFTSGGPLAVATQRALDLSDEMTMQVNWQVINCSMTRFKCTPETMMLSSFNEHYWLMDPETEGMITYR